MRRNAGKDREQTTMSGWQDRFTQKISMVKEASCGQFESMAATCLEPIFEDIRKFTSQQGLTAAVPVARAGIRSYKFAMTENSYVLMTFRFAAFEHCEMQAEIYVPGADPHKLQPEHVELANFDVGWTRRMFEQALDAFVDSFVASLESSQHEMITT